MSPDEPATPEPGKPDEAEKLEEQAAATPKQADDAEQPKARKRRAPRKAKAAAAEAKDDGAKDDGEEQKPAAKRARRKARGESPLRRSPPRSRRRTPRTARRQRQRSRRGRADGRAKPRVRSGGGKPVARRKAVRARARYVRTSARKARMVCGHLRGKSVQEARAILAFTPREVARDWSKLLESAVANAESNHELLEDDLVVREAYADEGPTIKRFRPRAMGRATPIRKRTSHLTITLSPRPDQQTNKRHR